MSGGEGTEAWQSALEFMVLATVITDFLDDRWQCRLGKPLSWQVTEPVCTAVPAHVECGCIRSKSNCGALCPPGGIKHSAAKKR